MIKCCLEWIVSRIIHFLRLFRYERCLWRLLFKIKSRINSLLALDRNFKRFDPISTIRSKCVLKKVFSTNMIFRIFHLFSSPLDTFVIAGEISRNLVFFSTHLVYQQGNESHHLLSLVARAARCPEKNGKTQEAREIKASRSFARANDRVCHDFNLLFFSLSLFPSSFFPLFLLLYIHTYTQISCAPMCSMCYRVFSLFVQWLAVHTLYAHLVERIFNERLNSFMVYL